MNTNCPFCNVDCKTHNDLYAHLWEAHGYSPREVIKMALNHAVSEHAKALIAFHEST